MNKIGIYSGTFDPVHTGHVAFALEAIKVGELQKVIFFPEEHPREKTPTPFDNRIHMLRSVLEDHKNLTLEVLSTPQFDIKKTLPEIRKKHSGMLVMLIGSDVVKTFSYRWPGLKELVTSVELIIGLRGKDTEAEVTRMMHECETTYGIKIQFMIVPSPRSQLASTSIRQGTHYIDDIDPTVAAYIKLNNLYADSSIGVE